MLTNHLRAWIALCITALILSCGAASAAGSPSSAAAPTSTVALPDDPGLRNSASLLWMIHAPQAWAAQQCTAAITYIDTGFNASADFTNVQGTSVVGPASDYSDAIPGLGHGTAVASLGSAQVNNSYGVAGTCGDGQARIIKVSTSASISSTNLSTALNLATSENSPVINLSLGSCSSEPDVNAAITNAFNKGAVVVIAAGNGYQNCPNPTGSTGGTDAYSGNPMAADNSNTAIRVAGLANNGQLAAGSNYGPTLADIAAPENIGIDMADGTTGGSLGGTSAATPLVAGAAAMLLSYNPNLTPTQVKADLLAGGTRVAGLDVSCGCILNVAGALMAAGDTAAVLSAKQTTPTKFRLALKITGSTCGTVLPKPDPNGYPPGVVITLVEKTAGCSSVKFVKWEGSCVVQKKSCVLTFNQNLAVTAVFQSRSMRTKK